MNLCRPAGLTEFPCCANNDAVNRGHRSSRFFRAALLALALGAAPGCTLFDRFGTSFTPDQPVAAVTVEGKIQNDRGSGLVYVDPDTGKTFVKCTEGMTLLWGYARNTGDKDVVDVFIEIDALNANKTVLDTYRVHVFNGQVAGGTPEDPGQIAGTSLVVDQSGTFSVCTRQPFGSVADTAYRTQFIVLDTLK